MIPVTLEWLFVTATQGLLPFQKKLEKILEKFGFWQLCQLSRWYG